MRQESQDWYNLTMNLEVVSAGTGSSGLTVTGTLLRVGDGQWVDPASGFTSATPVACTLPETSAPNLPGLYQYRVPSGYLVQPSSSTSANQPVYIACITCASLKIREYVHITTTIPAFDSGTTVYAPIANSYGKWIYEELAGKVWDQARASHAAAGTFGEYVNVNMSPATIATQVWQHDIASLTTYSQAGAMLTKLNIETGLSAVNKTDNRFVCNLQDSSGKFYASNVPTPATGTTQGYAGRNVVIWDVGANVTHNFVIVDVLTDGGGDYFQLARQESSYSWLETIKVGDEMYVLNTRNNDLTVAGVWNEAMSSYTSAGTFGEGFRRMLGLRQENMKIVYSAWNSANVPTAGKVYIYPSKAVLDADTGDTGVGSIGSYEFSGSFTSLKPTRYTSAKLT